MFKCQNIYFLENKHPKAKSYVFSKIYGHPTPMQIKDHYSIQINLRKTEVNSFVQKYELRKIQLNNALSLVSESACEKL